jgi:hypothetical protein
MQATHGNAAVGRSLARYGAGDARRGEVEGAAGLAQPQGHAEAEHLAGAEARQDDLDEGRIAQTALASARSALSGAVATWQAAATLVGVTVNSVTAIGGQVVGPPLTPLMLGAMLADDVPPEVAIAFAGVAGEAWLEWSSSVRVPGLPWYPAFAAFPSPVAPPTPNIPTPVVTLLSNTAPVSAGLLGARLAGALGARATDPHWSEAAGSFANWLGGSFAIWSASTMVTNVLGTGPVPSFAPPAVPVGPVTGGVGTMPPGGFVGPPFGLG